MKYIKSYFLSIAVALFCMVASSQNVSLNILTQNSGQVTQGGNVYLEVTVCNTDGSISVPVYKLRPQISAPTIVTIAATGHVLPTGWSIVSNTGSVVRLSNGTDMVPPFTCRTILLSLQGTTAGGPSTITSTMGFSNGAAPGSAVGTATVNDITGDNVSTSTVIVTGTVPLALVKFSAALENCKPTLRWVTENEINTSKFEVERAVGNSNNWSIVGTVDANGILQKSSYSFNDNTSINDLNEKVLYRLKMIDKDGSYKYSSILLVNVNCNKVILSVYPNPIKDGRLLISLTGLKKNAEATIISTSGQIILKENIVNGTNQINVFNVAKGMYILNVKDNNGVDKKTKIYIQ